MQRKIATLTDFLSLLLFPFEITSIVYTYRETTGGRIHVQIRFGGLGSSTIPRYRRFPRSLVGRGEIERWEAKKGVNKMSAYAADAILLRSGALSPYK